MLKMPTFGIIPELWSCLLVMITLLPNLAAGGGLLVNNHSLIESGC